MCDTDAVQKYGQRDISRAAGENPPDQTVGVIPSTVQAIPAHDLGIVEACQSGDSHRPPLPPPMEISTKNVKRAPARIPPLEVSVPSPAAVAVGRTGKSNNHAEADHQAEDENGRTTDAALEDDDTDSTPASDDVTVDDVRRHMDRVIDNLKQWRVDHARKVAGQYPIESVHVPFDYIHALKGGDIAREAAVADQDDAEHEALMHMYEVCFQWKTKGVILQAKARWRTRTPTTPKEWTTSIKAAQTPENGGGNADETKVLAMLAASTSSTDNVEKLQQLRHEVFELHVKDISRQLHRQMDLNNVADDDAFDGAMVDSTGLYIDTT
ncbi:hypothetical protein AaE_008401 [Aphanomyces astaci]|uniref:Uncharacterized protein n=1 Tax=Aphanomyces astaci TaxID=112090 RepID=A0A6A5ABD0_APHAT|nr:hypothetical protein AaE_008401 [Aphanomyces astaci]